MSSPQTAGQVPAEVLDFFGKERGVKNWISDYLSIKLEGGLHKSLQSGITLCYLLREIEPSLIPSLHEGTPHAFRMKENISFVLAVAEEIGVPEWSLFKVNDLYERRNMTLVIECIYQMFLKLETRYDLNVKLVKQEVTAASLDKSEKERVEEVDGQLKTMRIPRKQPGAVAGKVKLAPGIIKRQLAYLAGNKVDFERVETGLSRFQALFKGHRQRKIYRKLVREVAYRKKVAEEIYSTEKFYVNSLESCKRVYKEPLESLSTNATTMVVSAPEIKSLFSGLDTIININKALLNEMEPRVANWFPNQRLGDIFLKIMSFLKIYTQYVNDFDDKVKLIDNLNKKNDKFKRFIKEQIENRAEINRLDITAFLIMPVQRIPRYNLLLKDLVRHTWEDHQDFADLEKATKEIAQIGAYINEKKRDAENLAAMLLITENISGLAALQIQILKPHRKFVAEKSCFKEEKVVLLFNDAILVGKRKKNEKMLEALAAYLISNISLIDSSPQNVSAAKVQHILEIVPDEDKDDSKKKDKKEKEAAKKRKELLRLVVDSLDEKNELIKLFSTIKTNFHIESEKSQKAKELVLNPKAAAKVEQEEALSAEEQLRLRKLMTPKMDNRMSGEYLGNLKLKYSASQTLSSPSDTCLSSKSNFQQHSKTADSPSLCASSTLPHVPVTLVTEASIKQATGKPSAPKTLVADRCSSDNQLIKSDGALKIHSDSPQHDALSSSSGSHLSSQLDNPPKTDSRGSSPDTNRKTNNEEKDKRATSPSKGSAEEGAAKEKSLQKKKNSSSWNFFGFKTQKEKAGSV